MRGGRKYDVIYKDADALAGFGVYYLYGDKVVMEHTSDPESKVSSDGKMKLLPHVHIEVVDYEALANASLSMSDRLKAIDNFKIFDDTGYSPTATRLVRLGVSDPSSKEDKPKFNHHIYYQVPWRRRAGPVGGCAGEWPRTQSRGALALAGRSGRAGGVRAGWRRR